MSTIRAPKLFPLQLSFAGDIIKLPLVEEEKGWCLWEDKEKDIAVCCSGHFKGEAHHWAIFQITERGIIEAEHSTLEGALTFFLLEKLLVC